METTFFMYLSAVEGILIVCMLGWEIFWLRRMYQVLQCMPTSEQLDEMVGMIKGDRDLIKTTLENLGTMFSSVRGLFGLSGGIAAGSKQGG